MKPIIKVENLSKQYRLGATQSPQMTFRETLVAAARSPIEKLRKREAQKEVQSFWSLKDINFEIHPGEVVGIIGRNGAGKSTLLKILSRITEPTSGKIELYGRVGSLLEVGTGFHPELTGRENIYLNGAILGMRQTEIAGKFDEIVAFAEIEEFLDTPVKRYSSGMYTRLAFAVAANLEPEILIVDEVLAVGDAEFQKKCLGKMKDVSQQGRTVLFVSHNLAAVRQLCQRGIVLKSGALEFDGDAPAAVDFYMQGGSDMATCREWTSNEMPGNDNIKIRRAAVYAKSKTIGNPILTSDDLVFEIEFYNNLDNAIIDVTWNLMNMQGVHIAHIYSICDTSGIDRGFYKTKGVLPRNILNTERYVFNVQFGRNQRELLFQKEDMLVFDIENSIENRDANFNKMPGVIHPHCEWTTSRVVETDVLE